MSVTWPGQSHFDSSGASLIIFATAEHGLRAVVPLFLCCHCENNCSSFGAVVLFPAVANLYQGPYRVGHVEVEERYFQG